MDPGLGMLVLDRQAGQPLTEGVRTLLWVALVADGIPAVIIEGVGIQVDLDDWERTETALAGVAELVVLAPWDDNGELRP